MKRSSVFIALVFVCVFCTLLTGCGIDAPFAGKKTDASPAPTSVIGAATTAAPTTAAPYSTTPPTASPSSSEVPASVSATAAPPTAAIPSSGTAPGSSAYVPATAAPASSQSGKPAPIQLRLSCAGEPTGEGAVLLTVDVILDCYDISIGSAKRGSVTLNGEMRSFVTQGFTLDSPGRNSLVLHSETFVVPLENGEATVSVSAEWNFNGSYGGQSIDVLSAEETVNIGQ
ncbi:MAG: hypothetical protein IJV00_01120 [Clostridia bacterium]|nr:hypothetical protein [Clostridia bacterium]